MYLFYLIDLFYFVLFSQVRAKQLNLWLALKKADAEVRA